MGLDCGLLKTYGPEGQGDRSGADMGEGMSVNDTNKRASYIARQSKHRHCVSQPRYTIAWPLPWQLSLVLWFPPNVSTSNKYVMLFLAEFLSADVRIWAILLGCKSTPCQGIESRQINKLWWKVVDPWYLDIVVCNLSTYQSPTTIHEHCACKVFSRHEETVCETKTKIGQLFSTDKILSDVVRQ